MIEFLRYLARLVLGAVRYAVGAVAALLPRRYWAALDGWIPVSRAALLSSLATFCAGAILGIPGFLRYATGRAGQAIDVTMQATGWKPVAPGAALPTDQMATGSWLISFFSFFEFALFTPLGLFTTYLAITGVVRAASVAADDPRGDPVVSLLDAIGRRVWGSTLAAQARGARERREGPEVPDRVVSGKAAGISGAEIVIVASRRKPDWEAGVFVVTSDKWYRLGEPVERETPSGLRTLYPLNELRDHEAMRRAVSYEFPPGR